MLPQEKLEVAEAIKQQFLASGRLQTVQTQLRSELFLAVANNSPGTTKLGTKLGPSALVDTRMKQKDDWQTGVSWLISQHLVHHKHYITNSLLCRETSPGSILTGVTISTDLDKNLSQYTTEIATQEGVDKVLTGLGIGKKETRDQLYSAYVSGKQSVLSCLIDHLAKSTSANPRPSISQSQEGMSNYGQTSSQSQEGMINSGQTSSQPQCRCGGSVGINGTRLEPEVERSLMEKLADMESKYEEIRQGTLTTLPGSAITPTGPKNNPPGPPTPYQKTDFPRNTNHQNVHHSLQSVQDANHQNIHHSLQLVQDANHQNIHHSLQILQEKVESITREKEREQINEMEKELNAAKLQIQDLTLKVRSGESLQLDTMRKQEQQQQQQQQQLLHQHQQQRELLQELLAFIRRQNETIDQQATSIIQLRQECEAAAHQQQQLQQPLPKTVTQQQYLVRQENGHPVNDVRKCTVPDRVNPIEEEGGGRVEGATPRESLKRLRDRLESLAKLERELNQDIKSTVEEFTP